MRDGLGAAQMAVLWDGLSVKGSAIRVTDKVMALSMNMPAQGADPSTAKPAPVDLSGGKPLVEPKAIALPAAMEAAIR